MYSPNTNRNIILIGLKNILNPPPIIKYNTNNKGIRCLIAAGFLCFCITLTFQNPY